MPACRILRFKTSRDGQHWELALSLLAESEARPRRFRLLSHNVSFGLRTACFSFQAVDGKFSELVSCKASSLEGPEVEELTAEPESELRAHHETLGRKVQQSLNFWVLASC